MIKNGCVAYSIFSVTYLLIWGNLLIIKLLVFSFPYDVETEPGSQSLI